MALPILPLLGLAAQFVPSLAGMLLGSKAESVTEKVVNAAKEIFCTDDPGDIEAQITADNNKAMLWKAKIEADTAEYRIQVEDTASARARDVEVRKISGGTNMRANVMLVGAFVCLCGVLIGTIWYRADIPDGVLAILNTACGSLLTLLGQAFNFEFGSSRGSSEKSDQLATMLSKIR